MFRMLVLFFVMLWQLRPSSRGIWHDFNSGLEIGIGHTWSYRFSRWWFQIFFIFTPIWGRFSNLTNIFQMGWNHQPVFLVALLFGKLYSELLDEYRHDVKPNDVEREWTIASRCYIMVHHLSGAKQGPSPSGVMVSFKGWFDAWGRWVVGWAVKIPHMEKS